MVPIIKQSAKAYMFAFGLDPTNQEALDRTKKILNSEIKYLSSRIWDGNESFKKRLENRIVKLKNIDPNYNYEESMKNELRERLSYLEKKDEKAKKYISIIKSLDPLYNPSYDIGRNLNKSKCFIATAAYGSYLEPEVKFLRNWRDTFLSKSYLGRLSLEIYYKISPPVADYISRSERLKKYIRYLLNGFIKIIKKCSCRSSL